MTSNLDFDRLLEAMLAAEGPSTAPPETLDAALRASRAVSQRRPLVRAFDGRSWPAATVSVANPQATRLATIGLVALLAVALVAAAVTVGSRLLRLDGFVEPTWTATGSMREARLQHTSTLLLDGRVLVAGGGSATLATAELYDPATETWSATGNGSASRAWATATRLIGGKVLVAGGTLDGDPSAELWDPATGTWTDTRPMTIFRTQHAAVLLPDGKVLVIGGGQTSVGVPGAPSAELFDPATGTWTSTGPMTVWRASPTAAVLHDGTVLAAGGFGTGPLLDSAELYDPDTDTWTPTGSMGVARADGTTATLLEDGTVLVAGGPGGYAETYDPATGRWTPTGPMAEGEGGHAATLLGDGRVLASGGTISGGVASNVAQLYDPTTRQWSLTTPMLEPRISGVAVLLDDGSVLVTGGSSENQGGPLSSAERFSP